MVRRPDGLHFLPVPPDPTISKSEELQSGITFFLARDKTTSFDDAFGVYATPSPENFLPRLGLRLDGPLIFLLVPNTARGASSSRFLRLLHQAIEPPDDNVQVPGVVCGLFPQTPRRVTVLG